MFLNATILHKNLSWSLKGSKIMYKKIKCNFCSENRKEKEKMQLKEKSRRNQGFSTSTEDGLMSLSILGSALMLASLAPSLASLWNLHIWQPNEFLLRNILLQNLQVTKLDLALCISRICRDKACQDNCWPQ